MMIFKSLASSITNRCKVTAYITMEMSQKTMTLRIRLMIRRISAMEVKKERMSKFWVRKAKKKQW